MTMALVKLLDEGDRLGGIPLHIDIDTNEAELIVYEYAVVPSVQKHYTFYLTTGNKLTRIVALPINIKDKQTVIDFIADWQAGKIEVQFQNVKLVVNNSVDKIVNK
jgi:hypothetical protein